VAPRRSALDRQASVSVPISRKHNRLETTANSSPTKLVAASGLPAAGKRREKGRGLGYIQGMLRAFLVRAAAGLAVVVGVVTLMFFLIRLAPGDPALLLVGPNASEEQLATQRKVLGLDRPLPEQYGAWLARFVGGDWGSSIATGRPVLAMIADAWPATVRLVGLSLLLSYILGILVGAVQAARGGRLDTTLSVISVTLFALPGYWLGLMLVMVFTYWARALPAFGAAGFDADFLTGWSRVADRLRHLALPLATLTLIGIGGTARFVRGAMLDVRGAPHVAIARAKGLSPTQVTLRHVLRNALIPVLTLLGLSLPALFSGAVFIEAIFAWPGVGRIMVEAVGARDYPVIMAATAVSATLVVTGNLVAEALAAWADPRLRTVQGS
jgi:peptide/nickel transport system permease protein